MQNMWEAGLGTENIAHPVTVAINSGALLSAPQGASIAQNSASRCLLFRSPKRTKSSGNLGTKIAKDKYNLVSRAFHGLEYDRQEKP